MKIRALNHELVQFVSGALHVLRSTRSRIITYRKAYCNHLSSHPFGICIIPLGI